MEGPLKSGRDIHLDKADSREALRFLNRQVKC